MDLIEKEDRNVCINVTLRHVRVIIVAVGKKDYIFWAYVFSLGYLVRRVHAPYYIDTCGLSGCTIFFNIVS
jgi:hypothetical protein